MKKYITLAALLAAGTACANAATLVANYGFDQNLNNSLQTDSSLASHGTVSSEYILVTDGDYALKYTDNNNSGYYRDNFGGSTGSLVTFDSLGTDWALSFDVCAVSSSSFQTLFQVGDDFRVVLGNGASDWGSGVGLATTTYGNRLMSTSGVSLGDWHTVTIVSFSQKLYLCVDGTDVTSTLTNNNGEGFDLSARSLSRIKLGYGADYGAVSGTQFNNLKCWDLTGDDTFKTIKEDVGVVIPEPSAFGLLAGVGALALVASRRRRR